MCEDPIAQMIEVNYELQFPVESCSDKVPPTAVVVNVGVGSPALAVLEGASNISRDYRFTATYFNTTLGYFIDTINGTTSECPCFWFFYVQEPGGQPELADVGVSNYIIPGSGYSVMFRYESSGAKANLATVTLLLLLGFVALIFN